MKARHFRALAATLALAAMCAWGSLPKTPLLDGISFSHVVTDRAGRPLRITLTPDEKLRVFTPLSEISPAIVNATLLHEDRYFNSHTGINPVSTLRAAWGFVTGHERGGSSTITMQVARLRYNLRTRTLSGKANQMFYALALERHYSKAEILEAYFNLAPYGRNIEGIGAASALYLNKAPANITGPEAVALSLIPQSPERRTPLPGRANPFLVNAQRRVGQSTPFILTAPAAPVFEAPHFVNAVLERSPDSGAIRTTLDLPLQQLLERRIRAYIAAERHPGVRNAAAMLVDTKTMDVLAEVGSAGFFNAAIQGQVDGTRSPRSPGSAMKPFIYALALDQGMIHPRTLLIDEPHRYGEYDPENFDGDFAGPISATDALARSRNLPAVELLSKLRHPTFYEFLKSANVPLARSEKDYGLTLALGGEEISMENMARLYCMLANDGSLRPLRRTLLEPAPKTNPRMLSPEAAFLTLDMLAGIPAPGALDGIATRSIFWKTGTSQGFRDAWSVAVFDHYVLAVWIGNFDGKPNPAFTGRTCAAPLLFQIIDSLERRPGLVRLSPHEPPAGANLKRVRLCAVSGELPNDCCEHTVEGWFIPGVSPITTCTVHRAVLIDVATGLRVPRGDGIHPVRREICEFWPSNLLSLFEKAGLPRATPPPFLPGSTLETEGREGTPPRILSPASDETYAIRPDAAEGHALPLLAEADADVQKLYWFAGRRYLGSTTPRQPLVWQAEPGDWQIMVLDDQGRSATRRLNILTAAR